MKNLKNKIGVAVLAASSFVASQAMAADVDISAAVTSATTDIKTAGGLIVGVVVAVAAFTWIRRVIK